jgi:hypothetical protein
MFKLQHTLLYHPARNSALFPNLRKQTAPKTKKKKLWDDEMEQTRRRKKANVSSLLPKTDKQHKQKKEK